MLFAALCFLTFTLALCGDYVETMYVRAVASHAARRAALCSIAMWALSAIGFIAIVEVSVWLILPEGAGLWCGTMLAMRPKPVQELVVTSVAE